MKEIDKLINKNKKYVKFNSDYFLFGLLLTSSIRNKHFIKIIHMLIKIYF